MTYKTHILGGICAVALVNTVNPIEDVSLVMGISALTALIPDIDTAESKLGRKLEPISQIIENTFGHRGLFHTPILYVILYSLLSLNGANFLSIGFLIGTLSHLVLDSFNYKGVMWLYPINKKHYHIMSIKTRSKGEFLFCFVMIFMTCFFCLNDSFMNSNIINLNIINNDFLNNCMLFIKGMLTF